MNSAKGVRKIATFEAGVRDLNCRMTFVLIENLL